MSQNNKISHIIAQSVYNSHITRSTFQKRQFLNALLGYLTDAGGIPAVSQRFGGYLGGISQMRGVLCCDYRCGAST